MAKPRLRRGRLPGPLWADSGTDPRQKVGARHVVPNLEVPVALGSVKLGELTVSRFILGGNPQSGFSHFSVALDEEMMDYFTAANAKALLQQAEELGVTTHIGRADHHIMRVLREYWNEGGTIQWIAQTCPELGPPRRGVENGLRGGAKAAFIHGGQTDHHFAQGKLAELQPVINMIRDAGLPAGVAAHRPEALEWVDEHLDADFYMCCYYNPMSREKSAEHVRGADERFDDADRERMTATIQHLSKPAIHYKIMACRRNEPRAAFAYAASKMRPQDAVCVGIYPNGNPGELKEDLRLLEEALQAHGRR